MVLFGIFVVLMVVLAVFVVRFAWQQSRRAPGAPKGAVPDFRRGDEAGAGPGRGPESDGEGPPLEDRA